MEHFVTFFVCTGTLARTIITSYRPDGSATGKNMTFFGHHLWMAPSRRVGGLEGLGDGSSGWRWSEYARAIVRLL